MRILHPITPDSMANAAKGRDISHRSPCEKKGQSPFLIPQRRPPASPFFFHAGGQRAARPAPRQSRRHRDFALAAVEGPTGNVNQSTGDAVHVRSKGDRVRKRNGRRGRGGDPRRLQLCGDEVRRERNLHRRVSKKRGFIGASAPSFFIRNVRPADSCYIRLTRLLGQVVSQGLQFLHNLRQRASDHQRRRPHRQGGRAGGPLENMGAQLVREVAAKISGVADDSATTGAHVLSPMRPRHHRRPHPHPIATGARRLHRTAVDAHPSTLHHRRRAHPHRTTAPPQPAHIIHAMPQRTHAIHVSHRRPAFITHASAAGRTATALNRRSCPLLPLRLTGTPDLARSHFCRFSTISLSPGVFQTSPTPDPPPETKNRSKSTFLAIAWQVRTI